MNVRNIGYYLFHDLLSAPMFHNSVLSVITAHKLTAVKRDVDTVVSDQRWRSATKSILMHFNSKLLHSGEDGKRGREREGR